MKYFYRFFLLCILLHPLPSWSQLSRQNTFTVIPLGVKGGIDESNLSAYLVKAGAHEEYICLDAGTLHAGIQKAIAAGLFTKDAKYVLRNYIKGYCISHPHLDHVAGLIINSPDDSNKNIYGLSSCLSTLSDHYFTWKSWANFGDAGEKPVLKKYHYDTLSNAIEKELQNTGMYVTAFPLSHVNPYESTAFLIRKDSAFLLYLGDTGSDTVEHSDHLYRLWKEVAPLIQAKKLKAIFIEVSFPDAQLISQLFGHLTPALLMKEMDVLEQLSGSGALKNFPIVITHMKLFGSELEQLKKEIVKANKKGMKIVFAEQAKRLRF